jgi:phosphate transport system substrate-binding protein
MHDKGTCRGLLAVIRQGKNSFSLWLLFLLCLGVIGPAKGYAETLMVGGTGGALGTMHILAHEFMGQNPGITVEVLPSLGSGGGIKAVMQGAIDVGLSARKLQEAERQAGLIEVEIGATPFVVIVGKNNPSNSITLRELVEIYTGKLKNWPDGSHLRLILRPDKDNDITILRSISPEMNAAVDAAQKRPGQIVCVTDQDNADRVEAQPGLIGTSTLAQILTEKRSLKTLAINSVIPSPATIASKEYPLYKTFYLICAKEPSFSVRQLLSFVQSDRGQRLLSQYGFLVQP